MAPNSPATFFDGRDMDPGPRMPPYNATAEDGLIGAILLDNDAYHKVAGTVKAEDFFGSSASRIFRVVSRLMDTLGSVEPIGLVEQLVAEGVFPMHFGPGLGEADEAVFRMMDRTPSAAHAEEYAAIVRQRSVARKLIEAARKIADNAYAYSMPAGDQVELAERLILSVSDAASGATVFSAHEAALESVRAFMVRREGGISGVSSGFRQLDDMLGGSIANQAMVMVGARPSMGKTSFGLNVCENAASAGIGSYFASLEMNKKELGDRLICGRAGVPSNEYRRATCVTDEQYGRIVRATEELAKVRIHINESASQTSSVIASAARREKVAHGIGLVLVDYIQFVPVEPEDIRTARPIQLANMSRRLKTLAKDLDLPVVVLSQLNRDCDGREDKRPRMSDLKESGALEQDADVVLLLHRPDYYDPTDRPGIVEVIIAKNRNGPTGIVELKFIGQLTRFMDKDEDGAPDFI